MLCPARKIIITDPKKVNSIEPYDKYPLHSCFFPACPTIVSQSASINTDTQRYLFDAYSTKLYSH